MVYLIDDDAGVRRSLARMLMQEGFKVVELESAEAFLALPEVSVPACVVLDVSLPGLDGLALQRHLNDTRRRMPIVFLTGYGDIPMTVSAMKAGAIDFLTKPVSADRLIAAVIGALEQVAGMHSASAQGAELARRFASLTDRERQVLAGLIDGKLNKQIAGDLGIVEQTVKFHRARIMERMQARTVAELMHMIATLRASEAQRTTTGGAAGHPLSRGGA